MCGIIGYVGNRSHKEVLYRALKNMEYRGYDSAGIAYVNHNFIEIKKDVGSIDKLFNNIEEFETYASIGHTRWATHGKISKENAHPHTNCKKNVALVHNGTLENIEEIKNMLKGHRIASETDSELIAHLLEDGESLIALENALKKIKGTYSLAILRNNEKRVYFARYFSPLYIGIGEKEMFVASDISAFSFYTKNIIPLKDGDYGYITHNSYKIFNNGKEVKRESLRVNVNENSLEKGNYTHFMEKEIYESKHAFLESFSRNNYELLEMLKKADRIDIIGSGTSFHAAYTLKIILEKFFGMSADSTIASEYILTKNPNEKTLVVAFSQSGETADVLEALRYAKEKNAKIVAITNVTGSSITFLAQKSIITNAGFEVGVAATKSFAAQLGIIFSLLKKEYPIKLDEIARSFDYYYNMRKELDKWAKYLINYNNIFFLGNSLGFPLALEGALKFKEITYKNAQAYPSGELKHGPLSLIDEKTAVIFLNNNEIHISNHIEEVKARKAALFGLGKPNKLFDHYIPSFGLPFPYSYIEFLIPIQYIAYRASVLLNLNPDKPRNLAKSITVL